MKPSALLVSIAALLAVTACSKKKSAKPKTDPGTEAAAGGPAGGDTPAVKLPPGTKAMLGGGGHKGEVPYNPSAQGFKFQNYGNEDGVENLTPDELKRMFGDAVCGDLEGGVCTLTPAAEKWMEETNKGMDGGHCEGMAATSLLFELGKLKPSDFGAATAYELDLAGNKKLQHEVAYWFSTQAVSPMSEAEIRTLTPIEVADKLTEAFKTGTESYTIGIYKSDGSGGHATTPYAVVDKSDKETWIMHYDNNFPGEERHIDIDRTTNTWKYFAAANPNEPGSEYTGDADSKTLTIAPTSVRTGPMQCPFCGDVDKETGADAGKGSRQLIMDGDGDLLVTEDDGKRIGHVDGKLVNEIPGAKAVPMKSFKPGSEHEPIYDLPNGHALKVVLDGSTLKKEESSDVSLIGPGYDMGVYGVALDPGEKDEIDFSADWKEISYKTEQQDTPEIELGIETSGADYEFIIHAGGESTGQQIDLSLDVKAGTLTVQATAKDGESSYEVEIHRIAEGGEKTFKHQGLSVGSADKFIFHYADWKGDKSAIKVGVDKGGDGDIDETEDLSDED